MGEGFIDATDQTFYCNACWEKFDAEKDGGVGEMSRLFAILTHWNSELGAAILPPQPSLGGHPFRFQSLGLKIF
jgi:hypothetical protein